MISLRQQWTWPQIRFAGACWREGMSCDQIADAILDQFAVVRSKNAVIGISQRHRDLFPIKPAEQIRARQSAAAREAWVRAAGGHVRRFT